jgi:leader peptidase (prepilin peptidase)/N-methyltransferase
VLEKIVIALVVFVMGIAVNLITRNSIGLGDIKLFATVALFVDKERICDVIVYSIFVMGIISAIMLITKKKGRKDVVPFAPAILIAVVVTWVRYL